ncbi:MAG: SDR family oxidoreductase [Deltaproteobacteria bacterium]|nr:SDR family oxidoreductase [Deltaproteobacteria bacterium]
MKTFVITGANTGIGKVAATELAKRGNKVLIAGRSREKTQPVCDAIGAEFVALDLGDLASVRRCAESLKGRSIDVLVCNAGLAGHRGTTKDGFEIQFGTNHLGHYLLTRLLVDDIKERVVMVASDSHYGAKGIDWAAQREKTKSVTGYREYEVSKLANVLFAQELARRVPRLHTYALHPGAVATDVWRRVPPPFRWVLKRFLLTPEQGAVSMLRAASDPALANDTGKYYNPKGEEKRPSKRATPELARELWERSAEWVGLPS